MERSVQTNQKIKNQKIKKSKNQKIKKCYVPSREEEI